MRRISNFQWLFFLAAGALIVFAAGATSLYINLNRLAIEPRHFIESASFWVFWVWHAPLVFLWSRGFSFERRRLARNLLIHLSAGTVWAMIVQGLPAFFLLVFKDFTGYQLDQFHLLSDWATMFLPNMLLYWLILSISLISLYFERYQNEMLKASKLDAQLSNARLQALQMQLHPHFLFNTLHSITALVLKNENRDAVKMINRLSEFLRLTLDKMETRELTLADEIEFTRRYLEIESIRFRDRLTIEWDIDRPVLAAQVPNLILQPLVENAMRHGVDSSSGTSRIQIAARLQDDRVLMEVRDDGKNPSQLADRNENAGLGLKTTRARLSELYGGDYSFSLSRRENEWTVARIAIPFLPAEDRPKGELS